MKTLRPEQRSEVGSEERFSRSGGEKKNERMDKCNELQ
jgi:hypothetical protein